MRIAELQALKDESNAIGEEMRSVKQEKLKAENGTTDVNIFPGSLTASFP